MRWEDLPEQQCSMARTSVVLGDRWTLVILSDVFLGVRRFDDFQKRLGISRTTLANRLKLLEEHGVLTQRQYQDKPPRSEYRLTEKGVGLYPAIIALLDWGDEHYSDAAGPPILRRHKTCGHDFRGVMHCSECGEAVSPRDVEARKREADERFPEVKRGPFTYAS
ncbi:winged helix-turn-helix transcriptional regulator [Pyruvatibacter sp. HU-CL02332]|uniref:winged helix-turn-helix transcriptional regulator n=1 Tax=Pyruvatibacter sp. HU-CL02332 TaxID=3127650 RepID=UPI0029688D80|nr:helix-turn-helix domain-containing protein [Alphaproteobacteria bacterium]